MSKSTAKEKANFSFETVACMIATYESGCKTLGTASYELMAKLDGKRSACAFQHQFRDVKTRARELATELKDIAASPGKKSETPKKKSETPQKRGRQSDEDDHDDKVKSSGNKKPKSETSSRNIKQEKKELTPVSYGAYAENSSAGFVDNDFHGLW